MSLIRGTLYVENIERNNLGRVNEVLNRRVVLIVRGFNSGTLLYSVVTSIDQRKLEKEKRYCYCYLGSRLKKVHITLLPYIVSETE